MSITRIIFIIVCVVVAALVFTVGFIIQRNNPDSKYSLTKALSPKPAGQRRKKFRLPKNPSNILTIFLILLLLFLVLYYSNR